MTRTLSKHIFIPLLERISNGSTLKCLQELNRTQWLPVDDLKQIQQNRLQSLITHTYENVPFYRKILQERGLTPDNIKTVEDLSKLPILTKQDIREHFEELIAVNYSKKRMKLCSTGGSTGEPLDFLKPKDLGWSFGAWLISIP